MKKFPWDCEDCPLLHTYDLSIDDLTYVCLWSKKQIDDCDRHSYAECPLEKHDAEIRSDECKKVLEEVLEITKTIEAADILAMAESCDQNCNECDGCLTRILFEQLKGERT